MITTKHYPYIFCKRTIVADLEAALFPKMDNFWASRWVTVRILTNVPIFMPIYMLKKQSVIKIEISVQTPVDTEPKGPGNSLKRSFILLFREFLFHSQIQSTFCLLVKHLLVESLFLFDVLNPSIANGTISMALVEHKVFYQHQ